MYKSGSQEGWGKVVRTTINVIDFEPRNFTDEDERTLAELAGAVMDQMELRISSREAVRSLSSLIRHTREQDDDEGGLDTRGLATICAWTKSILIDGEWITFEEFLETELGLKVVTHGIRPDEAARIKGQTD